MIVTPALRVLMMFLCLAQGVVAALAYSRHKDKNGVPIIVSSFLMVLETLAHLIIGLLRRRTKMGIFPFIISSIFHLFYVASAMVFAVKVVSHEQWEWPRHSGVIVMALSIFTTFIMGILLGTDFPSPPVNIQADEEESLATVQHSDALSLNKAHLHLTAFRQSLHGPLTENDEGEINPDLLEEGLLGPAPGYDLWHKNSQRTLVEPHDSFDKLENTFRPHPAVNITIGQNTEPFEGDGDAIGQIGQIGQSIEQSIGQSAPSIGQRAPIDGIIGQSITEAENPGNMPRFSEDGWTDYCEQNWMELPVVRMRQSQTKLDITKARRHQRLKKWASVHEMPFRGAVMDLGIPLGHGNSSNGIIASTDCINPLSRAIGNKLSPLPYARDNKLSSPQAMDNGFISLEDWEKWHSSSSPLPKHRHSGSVATMLSNQKSIISNKSSRSVSPKKSLKNFLKVTTPNKRHSFTITLPHGSPPPVPKPPPPIPMLFRKTSDSSPPTSSRCSSQSHSEGSRVSSLPSAVIGEYDKEKWRTLRERARLNGSIDCI